MIFCTWFEPVVSTWKVKGKYPFPGMMNILKDEDSFVEKGFPFSFRDFQCVSDVEYKISVAFPIAMQ